VTGPGIYDLRKLHTTEAIPPVPFYFLDGGGAQLVQKSISPFCERTSPVEIRTHAFPEKFLAAHTQNKNKKVEQRVSTRGGGEKLNCLIVLCVSKVA